MKSVLVQKVNTVEVRSVSKVARERDDIELVALSFESLCDQERVRSIANHMPVGSVEFVRQAMKLQGIPTPVFNSHPADVISQREWGRNIDIVSVFHARQTIARGVPVFIKPTFLKQFNGFVANADDGSEFYKEQIEVFNSLCPSESVYIQNVLEFKAEWRVYVTAGKAVAISRYDDRDEEFDIDLGFVDNLVGRFSGMTLAIDVGLTEDGTFVVVELTDAWAIGKYMDISDSNYFDFLWSRWLEINR